MPCSRTSCTIIIIWALQLVLLISDAEANSSRQGASASAWLKNIRDDDPRAITGCWSRPWICDGEGEQEEEEEEEGGGGEKKFPFPPEHHHRRRMCCKNRCIDVINDNNNCGLCGIRCLYTWQCCDGLCIDVNVNPFHCGKCRKRCPLGSLCMFGMCDYAHLPPFPFPFPFPPKPPMPPYPHLPNYLPSKAQPAAHAQAQD